jgi:hypothetical protein
MSLLITDDGRFRNIVLVDARSRTLVAAFEHFGRAADDALDALRAKGTTDPSLENITHPSCPDWVRELAMADPEWRSRKADILDAEAAKLRRTAEEMLARADAIAARADALRPGWADGPTAPRPC